MFKERITADRPNQMCGTNATTVQVAQEGLVWIFAAVEQCDLPKNLQRDYLQSASRPPDRQRK